MQQVQDELARWLYLRCTDPPQGLAPWRARWEAQGFALREWSMVDLLCAEHAQLTLECWLTHHLRVGQRAPCVSHVLGEVLLWR